MARETSYNGWPIIYPNEASYKTKKYIIPGSGRHLVLREGPAGFLLAFVALYVHEKIEDLSRYKETWDDWGYAYREVRDRPYWSCHASATAEDLNATKHPMGVTGSWLNWQSNRIRLLMVRLRGCVRWGGQYEGRKDEMHFEINRKYKAVLRMAKRLKKTKRGKRLLRANGGNWYA